MEPEIVQTRRELIARMKEEADAEGRKRLEEYEKHADRVRKVKIKETFGFYKQLKDGSEGKVLMFPDIEEMHTSSKYVPAWVDYSAFDAEITYFLRETLARQLCSLKTVEEDMGDMLTLYCKYWLPFGQLLTDMERVGFRADVQHLKEAEMKALKDKIEYEQKFLSWVHKVQEDAQEFNPSSAQQLQQLLFAPFSKRKDRKRKGTEQEETAHEFPRIRLFRVENTAGFIKDGRKEALKYREMKIEGLGIPPIDYTQTGMPAADGPTIKKLAGNPPAGVYGLAFEHFKNQGMEEEGRACCEALYNWLQFKQIETLLNTYIVPLQNAPGLNNRIHCSLNLNTETGRISCRKPNLQN